MAFLTLFFGDFEEKVIELTAMHGWMVQTYILSTQQINMHLVCHDLSSTIHFSNDELELDLSF